jgi:hypothetical protein
MGRVLVGLFIAAGFVVALATTGVAHQPSGDPKVAYFGAPRVDRMDDGSVVVSLDAAGDLAGLVTMTLRPGGNGSYVGDWAFTVAHVDNTDPATGVEPDAHGHDHGGEEPPQGEPEGHHDFVRLVQRGALSGSISGALLSFDPQGNLAGVVAPLAIGRGSMEFSGVHGSGSATLSGLTLVY